LAWWHIPIIPTLESLLIPALRQEDRQFKASLNYIVRPCLKNKQKNTNEETKRGGEGIKESDGGGKFTYDIFDTL
jgi:hypothetical protein